MDVDICSLCMCWIGYSEGHDSWRHSMGRINTMKPARKTGSELAINKKDKQQDLR